jgi:hypothetical protein
MSITRPSELNRIKAIAGDDPYRQEVLVLLAVMHEKLEATAEWQKKCDNWMREHDLEDRERFTRGDERMERIERSVGGVRSGVNDFEEAKQQIIGAKRFLLGVVAVIATIGGAIIGAFEIMKYWAKP